MIVFSISTLIFHFRLVFFIFAALHCVTICIWFYLQFCLMFSLCTTHIIFCFVYAQTIYIANGTIPASQINNNIYLKKNKVCATLNVCHYKYTRNHRHRKRFVWKKKTILKTFSGRKCNPETDFETKASEKKSEKTVVIIILLPNFLSCKFEIKCLLLSSERILTDSISDFQQWLGGCTFHITHYAMHCVQQFSYIVNACCCMK